MTHALYIDNQQRAAMAFTGRTPWHGLGQQLPADQPIDVWQTAAGLDYTVRRATSEYVDTAGVRRTFAGHEILYRSDTGAALGAVSGRYRIVQPGDFLEFFHDLCDSRGFRLETAGALKGGAVYWALAKTGHDADITGRGDRCNGYLLLSTSADGSRATDARFTSVRVVCNNTLSVALHANGGVRTKHSTDFSASATKEALGLVDFDSAWTRFGEQMRTLCDIRVTSEQATEYFAELLRPAGERAKPRQSMGASSLDELLNAPIGGSITYAKTDKAPIDRAIRGLADLEDCYYRAPGAAPGSAYGLVQGVTRFIDHVRGKDNDKRLTSAWFGQGEALKQKAVERALDLAQ